MWSELDTIQSYKQMKEGMGQNPTVNLQVVRSKTMRLKSSVDLRGTAELGDDSWVVQQHKRPL